MEQGQHRTERVVEAQRSEPAVLGVLGALLLAIAGFFGWQELHVQTEMLMVLAAATVAAGAWFASGKRVEALGPLMLLATGVIAGSWYGATKEPVLIAGMGIVFAAALAQAIWTGRLHPKLSKVHRMVSWHTVAATGLFASFAAYFQLFDGNEGHDFHTFLARRAVLTLSWLLSGVAMVLLGRKRLLPEVRDAGFLILAAAVGKLLLYDSTHLDGGLRIGTLVVGGITLVVASQLARKLNEGKQS
jgi:hypothetical protein